MNYENKITGEVISYKNFTKLENQKKQEFKQTTKELSILVAKAFFASCPFATKVYVSMKTKLPMDFIVKNWQEIISAA